MIAMAVAGMLAFGVSAPASQHSCYAVDGGRLSTASDILDLDKGCWVRETSRADGVRFSGEGDDAEATMSWQPCDYFGKGFRSEIAQDISSYRRLRQPSWGIENERRFPEVRYAWEFKIDDPDHLLGNWAGGTFIAQWHSSSLGNTRSKYLNGGSPVIGLFYTKPKGSYGNTGTLELTMKVARDSGYCKPDDESSGPRFCKKILASAVVAEGTFHKIDVSVRWDHGGSPGSVSALLDGKAMASPVIGGEGGASLFFVPNKQSDSPNYVKLGLYVQSKHKEAFQAFAGVHARSDRLSANLGAAPSFCGSPGRLVLTVRHFHVTAIESSSPIDRVGAPGQ